MQPAQIKAWLAELSPEEHRLIEDIQFFSGYIQENPVLELIYKALDLMAMRLQSLMPQIPCASGCFVCCEESAPKALPIEVALIQAMYPQVIPKPVTQGCGFLLAGKCQIYAARPLSCRLKGYSFYQAEQALPMFAPPPQPWSCAPEQERIAQDLTQSANPVRYMYLPLLNAYQKALQDLDSEGVKPQPLPLYFEIAD